MTKRVGPFLHLEPESDRPCSECGKKKECRPYGRNGADLCFDCAMKPANKGIVKANFRARLEDVEPVRLSQQQEERPR